MAEILSEHLGVDSDEENRPTKMNQADTDSVSSDSEKNVEPLVKKKRATKTIRNRGAALNEAKMKVTGLKTQSSNIYSNQVREMWQAVKSGKLSDKLEVDQNSDIEDEMPLLAKKKTPPKTRKDQKHKSEEKEECHAAALSLLSSDEEEKQSDVEITREEKNSSFVREPTPPPESPPPANSLQGGRRKKHKQSKGMKKAFKNLEMLRKVKSQIPDDSDVSIIYEELPEGTPEKEPVIMVKIRSRSGIQRFQMKQEENFLQVMQEMAQHENVPLDHTVMFLNDVTIQPYDTPRILKLHIADIIEFHVKKQGEAMNDNHGVEDLCDDPNVVHLRVQGKEPKSRLVIYIHKSEPMNKLMMEYAFKQNLNCEKLSFQFDGEELSRSDTPEDLEMENDDCIDVIGC